MENYFDLYQLKPCFHIDPAILQRQYEVLDAQYRAKGLLDPDEPTQSAADHEAELNKLAFMTLSDPDLRLAHILKLYGFSDAGDTSEPDPDFLVEVIELQELVTEYELEPGNTLLREDATEALQTSIQYWNEETAPLFKSFDEGDDSRELMYQLKEYYLRSLYLKDIKQRMEAVHRSHKGP